MANRNTNQHKATFNLKVVVQETGLKPDTLRAWERRYGMPQPQRTAGGHRLYSQHDIDMLKWLIARQDEGLSISRAADLWRTYAKNNQDPLHAMPLQPGDEAPAFTVGDTIRQLREAWISACYDFNEQNAEHTLTQALAMYPPEVVCIQLLQKGLQEIGTGWYEGTVTAQQEHFASALAMRRLEALVAGTPPPTRSGRILIGCAPEEEHTFSALLLTLFLRRRGWETLYLGANVPIARLEATIQATEPRLVILTAHTLNSAANLLSTAQVLHLHHVPFAYGGLIFTTQTSVRSRIPGYFLGERLESVPNKIEQFLNSATHRTSYVAVEDHYLRASEHLIAKHAKLEARVWELLAAGDFRPKELAKANKDMTKTLLASLSLGDLSLAGNDLLWLKGLLTNSHFELPPERLDRYIHAYHQAAQECLGNDGAILLDWFESILN